MKSAENIYFQARKSAARRDERLNSREMAADLLGVSVSTLADYELGNTKVIPVDKVVLMADLYNAPELKTSYCKNECPIGRNYPIATERKRIEGISLRLIRELDPEKLRTIKKQLVEISEDGWITDDEKPALIEVLDRLDEVVVTISEIKIVGARILRKEGR